MCPKAEASDIPHCHHFTEKGAGIFYKLTENDFELTKMLQIHI